MGLGTWADSKDFSPRVLTIPHSHGNIFNDKTGASIKKGCGTVTGYGQWRFSTLKSLRERH